MMDASDMSTPVTRGELKEELARFKLEWRHDLEIWGRALIARMDTQEQRIVVRMEARIEALEQRLHTELARHTSAILEAMSAQIRVIDEKYTDLPGRVNRLEAKVFRPGRPDRPGRSRNR